MLNSLNWPSVTWTTLLTRDWAAAEEALRRCNLRQYESIIVVELCIQVMIMIDRYQHDVVSGSWECIKLQKRRNI